MKKVFPLSFQWADTLLHLIIGVVVYIVLGAIAGVAIGLLRLIPIVGIIAWIVGLVVEVYVVCGIILLILAFLKVVK